jgi:hypothetical protein
MVGCFDGLVFLGFLNFVWKVVVTILALGVIYGYWHLVSGFMS